MDTEFGQSAFFYARSFPAPSHRIFRRGKDDATILYEIQDIEVNFATILIKTVLCDGRRLAFGSSAHSVYYRTFFSASELQTNSLIHVLVHRLIAESVVRQSNEYSTTFHLRRAQAYRAMNDLIANHFISFQEKMSGFIILSILELALGFPDLHFKHVQAMNRYVEEQGDVLLLWEDTFNPGITPSLPWLFGYFMYDDVLLRNEEALSRAIEGFKSCIQGVEEWTTSIKSLQLWSSLRNDEQERFERRTREPLQLPHIQVYINYILKAVFNKHQSPNVGTAPFFVFLIGLCLTQVAYNYDAEQSINFLQQTERYMSEAPTSLVGDVSPGVCWLSSDMNPPMMWSVRHTICPMSKECEIMYGRFAFDILKIIPLLSWSGTRELAIGLSQCALSLVNSAKLKIPFGTQWAGKQAADIRSNWRQRNLA